MNTNNTPSIMSQVNQQPRWFLVSLGFFLALIVFFIFSIILSTSTEDCLTTSKNDTNKPSATQVSKPQNLPPPEQSLEGLEEEKKDKEKTEKEKEKENSPNPTNPDQPQEQTLPLAANKFGCQLPNQLPPKQTETPAVAFSQWQEDSIAEARQYAISDKTIDAVFQQLKPNPKVVSLDRRQAEYSTPFSKYLTNSISSTRIKTGKAMLKKHAKLLQKLEDKYGVQRQVLVALWAMESNFGKNMGDMPTINTLATLAHDGRRYQFFQNELRCALQMIEEGHIQPRQMKSSWAGAMGQVQFMPSTFVYYSADGDDDGKKDIWHNTADALASAARYLHTIHWQAGQSWGMEVKLPLEFDWYQARFSEHKSLQTWHELGVVMANGDSLLDTDKAGLSKGAIILPSGSKGPAFMIYDNFSVIREWNRSMFYALAVGHLSDRLIGKKGLVATLAHVEKPLSRQQAVSLQTALHSLGFYHDKIDGMLGLKSHNAIRDYQQKNGLIADAYPTAALIEKIRVDYDAAEDVQYIQDNQEAQERL